MQETHHKFQDTLGYIHSKTISNKIRTPENGKRLAETDLLNVSIVQTSRSLGLWQLGCWHLCEARGPCLCLPLLLPTKTGSSSRAEATDSANPNNQSSISPAVGLEACTAHPAYVSALDHAQTASTLPTEPSPQILFGIFLKSYISPSWPAPHSKPVCECLD